MSRGKLRWPIVLGFAAMMLLGSATGALADSTVVAQETPYQAPDIEEREPPAWLKPLEPLAALPLWGQAAVLSAGVAGLFFVIPMVGRWVWRLGPGHEETEDDTSEQEL